MKKIYLLLAIFICILPEPVKSEESAPFIVLGGGLSDYRKTPFGSIEYRSRSFDIPCLNVIGGALATTKGAFFVYGGFSVDICCKDLVITPSFSPGIYIKGGDKNLGFPIEFRSSIEICYVFLQDRRLGIQISHLSNAHLSSKNPGINYIALVGSLPLK